MFFVSPIILLESIEFQIWGHAFCALILNYLAVQAVVTEELTRPMPMDRHTTLLSGPDEDTVIAAGSLNLKQIREIFILYQEQGMNEESIAKKFNVDAELLKRIFRHTSLVVPDQAEELTFKDKK